MRIALLVHAFPPRSNTGVEVYSEALARALAGQGHEVEVFAAFSERDALHLEQRREVCEGYAVTCLTLSAELDDEDCRRVSPGAAQAFGRFLDRERPAVVHVQHFLGFGAGVIDEARTRDIPVLFTAHDGFAFCDEYTLIAPDLSPLDPLDSRAQARCRLARGVLDARLEQHDGYLVPELAPPDLLQEVRAALQATGDEVDVLTAQVERGLTARREALDRADHIEAPTQFLAEQLRNAGLQSSVHVRSCGIDRAGLQVEREPRDGPLRVLYLGGYFEHKGVHVLLEAARACGSSVQLTLRGCAGSGDYVQHLQRLASECGADLGGPFQRQELGRLLANADVLALPSLWPENAPFVLREAFAAGCPVLVSDTPALRESVDDGRDGRVLPMGDVQAWSAALHGLAEDHAALDELSAAVRAPKSIEQDATELVGLYTELVASREAANARRRKRLPEHLHGFAARHAALEALSLRELTRRCIGGLTQLSEARGVALPELQGAEALLQGAERLRERFAAARRSESWRATIAGDRERALADAEERAGELATRAHSEQQRASWQAGLREERERRLLWLESQVQDQDAGLCAMQDELRLARETCTELERRANAGAGSLQSKDAEIEWRTVELRTREEELGWTQSQLEDRGEHVLELQAQLQAQADGAREGQRQIAAREAELGSMREQLQHLVAELDLVREAHESLALDRKAAHGHQGYLEAELQAREQHGESMSTQLGQLSDELAWRTKEMVAAREEARSFMTRALGGRLLRRTEGWSDETDGEESR